MSQNTEAATKPAIHSQFIDRITKLPLVNGALGYAGDGYNRIKSSNALVGSTLNRAEQSIYYAAEAAKPIIANFETPISIADHLACQGLNKLEEVAPVLKQKPEEVYETGVHKYEELKKYGEDRIKGLKDYGYGKVNEALASPYGQAVIKSVDSAVDLTEFALNRYLPPAEGEPQTDATAKGNVVQRVSALSEKMRLRMYKQAMMQIEVIQLRSREALNHMKFSVDLIQYAKSIEEAGRKKVVDGVAVVQTQAKWLWTELNKEEPETTEEPKTLDQQVLSVARRATKQVVRRYNEMIALNDKLPENARKAIEASANYAKDVYSQLSKAESLKDVSSIAFHQIAAGATMLQTALANALSPLYSQLERNAENEAKKDN